jgi:hypothetical protein
MNDIRAKQTNRALPVVGQPLEDWTTSGPRYRERLRTFSLVICATTPLIKSTSFDLRLCTSVIRGAPDLPLMPAPLVAVGLLCQTLLFLLVLTFWAHNFRLEPAFGYG